MPPDATNWLGSLPTTFADTQRLFVHGGIFPGVPIELQEEDELLWMREPFLSSQSEHGFLVVHGHTPTKNLKPDLRHNRLNLDTGACFGGPLTARYKVCSPRHGDRRIPSRFSSRALGWLRNCA